MSAPNPPRRSVFAVWRWSRWAWIAVLFGAMITHLLVYPLFLYGTLRLHPSRAAFEATMSFWLPARWCGNHIQIINDIHVLEWHLAVMTFGEIDMTRGEVYPGIANIPSCLPDSTPQK